MAHEGSFLPAPTTGLLRTIGCTVVARNYLAYAQVLGDAWLRYHSQSPFAVLVVDDDDERPASDSGRRFLTPSAIGILPEELERLRGIYTVAEMTCAIKPRLIQFLLHNWADSVVYTDSDTDIHGSLNYVAELAAGNGIALSPHLLRPTPLDGRSPSELELSPYGICNSGFIAVGSGGLPFLDWWTDRVEWDCLLAEVGGFHADQRWLDWVPLYFEHAVIRDAGVNVAGWNLHERRLDYSDGQFTVNGSPLRTFHFAGFDPLRPERMSQYAWQAPLRVRLDDVPLARLSREYADKVRRAGYDESRKAPYSYDRTAAGTALGPWERRVYREALLAAEARGDRSVPGPFDPARSAEFERLLINPRSTGLLSEAALTRLADSRVAMTGRGWSRRRIGDAVQSRLARGLFAPRPPWTPYPLPGDRTRAEYERIRG